MKCLDLEGYHDAILETYSTLRLVDPLRSIIIVRISESLTSSLLIVNLDHTMPPSRRAYYKDMSSNLVIEKALKAASDFSCLDLEVTKEQAKGYNQYLAAFDSVRFAGDLE